MIDHINTDRSVAFRVVGVTFQPGYPANVLALRALVNGRKNSDEPSPALLIRAPGNVADSNAIEVHAPSVGRVGSVPARLAARLAPLLDVGERWAAHIESVYVQEGHEDRPGVSVIARRVN